MINKHTEYLIFDDILFYTWKLLPSLTAKSNPNELYIMNYLSLLEKMQIYPNAETKHISGGEHGKVDYLLLFLPTSIVISLFEHCFYALFCFVS